MNVLSNRKVKYKRKIIKNIKRNRDIVVKNNKGYILL